MSIGEVLNDRYRLDAIIGRGAHGMTWRATRLEDGQAVCVKALHFHHIGSFDAERLFRREASVLRQLDHPGVPDYIDDFAVEDPEEGEVTLYLVQELVDGHTLDAELKDKRYTEAEVLDLVRELLEILAYLQSLSPAVVHRDIKPANVMRRTSDDSLVLVDFGSVKDAVRETISGGATVAGTFGYMAPEQFYGRATPASDLYGVGALALTLLSRLAPAEMVDERNQLAWQPHVDVSPATVELLTWLLDTDPSQRAQRAADVLERINASRRQATVPATVPEASIAPTAASPHRPAQHAKGGSSGTTILFAAASVFLLAIGGFVFTLMPAEEMGPTATKTAVQAPGPTTTPTGLKGLHFGMTEAEATEALPELTDADRGKAMTADVWGMQVHGVVTLPGPRLTVDTGLLGHPARCELDFVYEDKLTRMECYLADPVDDAKADALRERLITALRDKYGPPSTEPEPHDPLHMFPLSEKVWTWSKDAHELTVTEGGARVPLGIGSKLGAFSSSLRIENVGPHWETAVLEANRIKATADQRERDAEARRRQLELDQRMKEIRERGGGSEDL